MEDQTTRPTVSVQLVFPRSFYGKGKSRKLSDETSIQRHSERIDVGEAVFIERKPLLIIIRSLWKDWCLLMMNEVFGKHDPYLQVGRLSLKGIVFGVGSYARIGAEMKQLIGRDQMKTLLVTDEGIEKAGTAEKVRQVIKDSKIMVETFSETEPEPTFRCLRKITEVVRSGKFDAIIGLGGGSSMDVAKTASIMATNPGDVADYYQFMEDKVKIKPLPKIMISTTSGTGSEVSFGAVATDDNGFKNFINSPFNQADISIVDPLMSVTCPPRLTAGCGMDALAHLAEAYVNFAATPLTDAFALHGIRLVAENLREAVYSGNNLTSRYNMAIASTLGGLCTSIVPVNVGHCISEGIGPVYKIPHGVANALVLPHQMRYNLPAIAGRIAALAPHLGVRCPPEMSTREIAEKSIEATKQLVLDVGLPIALKDINIPREEIPRIVDRIMKLHDPYNLAYYNPLKITPKNLTELVTNMWEGNV